MEAAIGVPAACWVACGAARTAAEGRAFVTDLTSCSRNCDQHLNQSSLFTGPLRLDHFWSAWNSCFARSMSLLANSASLSACFTWPYIRAKFVSSWMPRFFKACFAFCASVRILCKCPSDSSKETVWAARDRSSKPSTSHFSDSHLCGASSTSAWAMKSSADWLPPAVLGESLSAFIDFSSSSFSKASGSTRPFALDLAVPRFRTLPTARDVLTHFCSVIELRIA
mmetsp:Transcript_39512/g.92930  ORF Transcript_39512/g.92930 Transcript_39512/m.92930 type:complete len:225 (+) Transcript_39512:556-1230(+)